MLRRNFFSIFSFLKIFKFLKNIEAVQSYDWCNFLNVRLTINDRIQGNYNFCCEYSIRKREKKRKSMNEMHCKEYIYIKKCQMRTAQGKFVYKSQRRILSIKKGFESGSMLKQVLTKSSFVRGRQPLELKRLVRLCIAMPISIFIYNCCSYFQFLSLFFFFFRCDDKLQITN